MPNGFRKKTHPNLNRPKTRRLNINQPKNDKNPHMYPNLKPKFIKYKLS